MILDELVTVLGLEIKDDGLTAFRSSLTTTIGKLGTLVAGFFAASVSISAFLKASGEANAAAKFARSLDVGFESLQRLEFAAKRTGVEAGTLDGILANLRSQARGAIFGENDAAAEAFQKAGISLRDSAGETKDATELMLSAADAVFNSTNQPRTLQFLEALGFGPSTQEFLKLGRNGIIALGDEAEAMGAILSSDAAAGAERFAEKMAVLGVATDTFLVEQGEPLLNWAVEVAQKFLDFSQSADFEAFKTELGGVADAVGEIIALNKELIESFDFELPEGSGLAAIVAAAALLARAHPVGAAIATAAVVGADVQKFRKGEEGTGTGFLLATPPEDRGEVRKFLSDAAEFVGQVADFLPGNNLSFPPTVPSPITPGAGSSGSRIFNIEVNNDVELQGFSDPAQVADALDRNDGDTLREAMEDVESRILK